LSHHRDAPEAFISNIGSLLPLALLVDLVVSTPSPSGSAPLERDMDKVVARIELARERSEQMAVGNEESMPKTRS
jgi:hypothetical protein